MKQCKKCGNVVGDEVTFCTRCGAPMSEAPMPNGSMETNSPSSMFNMASGQPVSTAQSMGSGQMVGAPVGVSMESQAITNGGNEKKSNSKIVVMAIVSGICLVVGIVGIILAVIGFSKSGDVGQVAINTGNEGGNGVDVTTGGTKIAMSGYEFVLPKGYEYEIQLSDGEELLMFSNSGGYIAVTGFLDGFVYSTLKNNISEHGNRLSEKHGRTVAGSVKTIDGLEMICFNIGVSDGANRVLIYTQADLYSFGTYLLTEPGDDWTQYLSDVAAVLKTAQKKTKNEKTMGGFDFGGLKISDFEIILSE